MTWGQALIVGGLVLGFVAFSLAAGLVQRRERRREMALEPFREDWRDSIPPRYRTPATHQEIIGHALGHPAYGPYKKREDPTK